MSELYHKKVKLSYLKRLAEVQKELPAFCSEFFLGTESVISEYTRLHYAYDYKLFFKFLAENILKKDIKAITLDDLQSITQTDIEKYLNFLNYYEDEDKNARFNQARSKSRKLASVRTLFKYFFDKGKLSANVAAKVKFPAVHEKEIIRLEPDEVAEILDVIESGRCLSPKQLDFHNQTKFRDLAIMSLFLGTGIRKSELIGLDINDIDFKTNSFNIIRKGGNMVTLYFSDEVADALRKYYDVRLTTLAETAIDKDALFLSLQGKRMSARAIENLVEKYARIVAPLKHITPHKLRSTYGTSLYRETQDIYVVAEVLGHKDVNTTKKHYAATSEEIKRKAALKVKLRDDPK